MFLVKDKKRNLKNSLDVHWRTDRDGYESIMRQIFDESNGEDTLSDAERKRWFKKGWRERLEERRNRQRNQGWDDKRFTHPSLK